MARRLFTLLSALSLLLCVAVVVLWVRATRTCDTVHIRTERRWFVASTAGGHFQFFSWLTREHDLFEGRERLMYTAVPPAVKSREFAKYQRQAVRQHSLAGVHYLKRKESWEVVAVPWWLLALGTATPPGLWVRRMLRRRVRRVRLQRGLCPSCGYDLRATPGRCPECGAVPAGKEA